MKAPARTDWRSSNVDDPEKIFSPREEREIRTGENQGERRFFKTAVRNRAAHPRPSRTVEPDAGRLYGRTRTRGRTLVEERGIIHRARKERPLFSQRPKPTRLTLAGF